MFSRRKTYKKNWTLHGEIIQIWFHILYHCVPLFIAILQKFDSTHLNRINETISMFRSQTFDSMLKWFTSFIQLIYSAARGSSSSDFFPLTHSPAVLLGKSCQPCSAINMAGISLLPPGQRHAKASKFAASTHQRIAFTIVGDPSELPPFWISSLMQQCSNVLTAAIDRESSNDWAMLDSAFTPKVRYKFWKQDKYMTEGYWGSLFLHLIAPQLALKKAGRRFGTMPMFVKAAVTDMHRRDSCAMWQACAGYSKHLENRSVSSLHWK